MIFIKNVDTKTRGFSLFVDKYLIFKDNRLF